MMIYMKSSQNIHVYLLTLVFVKFLDTTVQSS